MSTFLREVAYRTSIRALRESIVFHLRHTYMLTSRDKDSIEFVNLIQTLYPNPCYTAEHARRWTMMSSKIRQRNRRRRRRVPMLEFVESDDEKSDGDVEEEEERMEHVTNDFLTAFAGCDVGDIGPEMSHSGFHFHNRHRHRRPVIETNTRLKGDSCISASSNRRNDLSRAQRLGAY